MRKTLIAICLFLSAAAYGQMDTVDLSITDFGIPSISGQADFVKSEAYKINQAIREIDTFLIDPAHMFVYFGDSTVSKSYSTSWAHLTNANDSLFIPFELDYFTLTNDTIAVSQAGHYFFNAQFTHDGDNVETVSIRFYNVTKTAGIPVAGASTCRAANNFMSTPVMGYGEVDAGDKIVVQYKGDANGTAVFKNGSIRILRVH